MATTKQIVSSAVLLDRGEDWIRALPFYLDILWKKVEKLPYVSISPIHIKLDFDPDQKFYPNVGMIIQIWVEIEC